jgi:hypothetical protein
VTKDRIGLRGGTNEYAYVKGDPISDSDPRGLKSGGGLGKIIDEILKQLGFPPTDPNGFGEKFGLKSSAEIYGAGIGFELARAWCSRGSGPPKDSEVGQGLCLQAVPPNMLAHPKTEPLVIVSACRKVFNQMTENCKEACILYPEMCPQKTSLACVHPEMCPKTTSLACRY